MVDSEKSTGDNKFQALNSKGYLVGKVIGEGGFASVRKAFRTLDGLEVKFNLVS